MFLKLLTARERVTLLVCGVVALIAHVGFFYATLRSGGGSLGVDGELYRQSALDCMASQTWLFEKSNNLFWTPWYVILGFLRADPHWVFAFNLLGKFAVAGLLAAWGISLIQRRWLRLGPAVFWLFYWPTYNYVIFFHYEIFLSVVCTALPVLVAKWVHSVREPGKSLQMSVLPILAGVILGVGIFSHARIVGAAAIIILPLLLLVDKRARWRFAAGAIVAMALGALPSLWWGYRNSVLYDKWVFSSTSLGYNLYVGYNELASGYFQPQPPYPPLDQAKAMALEYMRENPGRSIGLFLKRLVLFWLPSTTADFGPRGFVLQEYLFLPLSFAGYMVAILFALRLVALRLRGYSASAAQVGVVGAVLIIGWFQFFHAVFYVTNPRFRIPVIPAMSILLFVMLDRYKAVRLSGAVHGAVNSDVR